MLLRLFFWLFSLAIIAASFYFGKTVKFNEQWVLYEALRTTASIIFAVAGVWLAIIYPDRLKSPYKKTSHDPVHLKGFTQLFSPVINSVITLCSILLIGVTAPIAKQLLVLFELTEYLVWLRQASMGFLALLTMFQIYTVLSVLVPVLNILDKNEQDKHSTEVINELKGHRE